MDAQIDGYPALSTDRWAAHGECPVKRVFDVNMLDLRSDFSRWVPSRRWLELGRREVSGLFNPNDSGVGALERETTP